MAYTDTQLRPLVISETPGVLQRNWKTPARFPLCPDTLVEAPLLTYFEKLFVGDIAVITPWGKTTIGDTAMTQDGNSILLLGEHGDDAIKPWSLMQITFDNGYFVHESHGMFFSRDGAEKAFTLAQGLPWDGEDTIDDYC